MNRRNFLKLIAASAVAVAVPLPAVVAGAPLSPCSATGAFTLMEYIAWRKRVAMVHLAEMMEENFFAPAIKKIAFKGDVLGYMPVWMDMYYKEKP